MRHSCLWSYSVCKNWQVIKYHSAPAWRHRELNPAIAIHSTACHSTSLSDTAFYKLCWGILSVLLMCTLLFMRPAEQYMFAPHTTIPSLWWEPWRWRAIMQKCAHRRLLPHHMAYPSNISKSSFLQSLSPFSGSTFVYPTTTTSQLCSYPLFSPLSPRSCGVPTTTTTISQHLFLLLLYLLLQPTASCTPCFSP